MSNNNLFKTLLVFQSIMLLVYTFFTFKTEGADIFSIFIINIKSLTWNGQFNLDFSCYLLLSAIWITWRNKFSLSSFFIGIVAMIVGIMVFAPYLFWLLTIEKGNLKRVLIGDR